MYSRPALSRLGGLSRPTAVSRCVQGPILSQPWKLELRPCDKSRVGACFRDDDGDTFPVGEVGVAGEVVAQGFGRTGAHAVDVSGHVDPAGLEQIFDDVLAGLVHVRIDPVRGEVPCLPGEPDADIAADLTDLDRLTDRKFDSARGAAWPRGWGVPTRPIRCGASIAGAP